MRLGITMFATDRTMAPHELAREAESRGFVSFYIPEHTHIPVSRDTPPPTGVDTLPEEYARTLDPFVALAAAAAVTERIRLGTGVCLPAQREPIVTAKAVATLDQISGGRFVLGIGYGWNREEAADHDVPWKQRRGIAREHVLAMRELWTKEEASFKGEHVSFQPSWSWPKPAGHVPVLLGGAPGPLLFSHIAEYGDGWMPIGGAGIREALPALRAACEEAGREPVPVIPFGTLPTPEKLGYYASLGVEEVVLRVPAGGRDEVLPVLDEYATTHLRD
ncbi:LLM class F420-dependent oxidoreductase [Actinomadura rudentiformis]|uniref:LLM class F420-dependent oxidoreductase n=1 Tax=Actinomadura rudentiformis TaxID=359158 RepID=A0A6H9YMU0_9ACTN|nr:LLM class F420-dependent oxidoreductase [Actinomadura rudentiformis]KAB2341816.1 LLM class F420-dependent oxidoreductase [Actinomadura rudentiformis]